MSPYGQNDSLSLDFVREMTHFCVNNESIDSLMFFCVEFKMQLCQNVVENNYILGFVRIINYMLQNKFAMSIQESIESNFSPTSEFSDRLNDLLSLPSVFSFYNYNNH